MDVFRTMIMEKLYDAIASEAAEELKTLKEVLLMKPKPSPFKDPILDPKKDPIGGVKEPDTGGLKQKGTDRSRRKPKGGGKKQVGHKDPHDGGKKPIRFKQKIDRSGRKRPPLPDPGKKPCGGKKPKGGD